MAPKFTIWFRDVEDWTAPLELGSFSDCEHELPDEAIDAAREEVERRIGHPLPIKDGGEFPEFRVDRDDQPYTAGR